jgi:UDP-N-acetylmuramate dehydrogenase
MDSATFTTLTNTQQKLLTSVLGEDLKIDIPLAKFTSSRVGGPADGLILVDSVERLAEVVGLLWDLEVDFFVLGAGSNVLISDEGIRGLVIINRAKESEIDELNNLVWTGSGASFGQIARRVSQRGYSGLEWATGIPGTVGGAVYGNAGAQGSDVASTLHMAEILHHDRGREKWKVSRMGFAYRSSKLKRDSSNAVILSASFHIEESSTEFTKNLVEKYKLHRRTTQPSGASMGSMFKNPQGEYAGQLIERAGLKGIRIGGAEISTLHGNFFITADGARAKDIFSLIRLAQDTVLEKFNIPLELEIELIGDWESHER